MSYFLRNPEEIISSIMLGMMSVVIIVQVIFRYFISYSLAWPEELGRYLFIASVYIGSSYAEQKDRHLAITILRTNGGAWCKKWLPVFVKCVCVAFSLLLCVWGCQMVYFMYKSQQLAPAINIPMYYAYLPLAIGMAGMAARSALCIPQLLRDAAQTTVSQEH